MLTQADLNIFRNISQRIDALVKSYYDKFICGDETFRLCRWSIVDDNTIRIVYSYEDYLGYGESDYKDVTLDGLNKKLNLN